MVETLEKKRPSLAAAADSAIGVAHIDSFVRYVARTALNEEQMNRAVADIVGDSSYLFSTVKSIIIDRREAGRYDEILSEKVDPRIRASVTRNLARIGIEL